MSMTMAELRRISEEVRRSQIDSLRADLTDLLSVLEFTHPTLETACDQIRAILERRYAPEGRPST